MVIPSSIASFSSGCPLTLQCHSLQSKAPNEPFSTDPSLALCPAQPSLVLAEGQEPGSALARHSSHCKTSPWIFSMLWQPWKHSTPSRALGCLILNQYLQILEITCGEKYINIDKETKIIFFCSSLSLFFFLLSYLPLQNKTFVFTPPILISMNCT